MGVSHRTRLEGRGFRNLGTNLRISERCIIYGVENISLSDNVRIDDSAFVSEVDGWLDIGYYVHIGHECFLEAGCGSHSAPLRATSGVISAHVRLREFYLVGEEVKGSIECLIKGLSKVRGNVAYHGRRWYVHVASEFSLARYYQKVFGNRPR